MTNEQAGETLRDIGERVKKFREQLPADSPLHGTAFTLAKLCGEIEADLSASNNRKTRPAG